MAAGSIVVSLLMLTGSFETDTKKAERALNKLKKEAVDVGKVMGAALAAGAITAAVAFDKLIKGAADFKDLEETTGASAEDLASLALAAGTAGVGMDTLAQNSIRLTKNLTGVDDESKAAGAAIKALGLNLSDFKKLDPVAQMDALTKAFGDFEDGPQKAAVATALWGKSGAEMLKVMKALEEQGGRTKILTQEQIEQADAYADAQAKAGTELKLYAQAAATQGAPAFLALTTAAGDFVKELIGVDKETGKLGQSTAVKDFATSAVRAIAFVIDAGDGAIRVFKGLGLVIGGVGAAAAAVASGEFRQAKNIVAELGADLDALASRRFFSDELEARLAASGGPTAPARTRKALDFNGANSRGRGGPKAAKAEVDEVRKAIEALEEELALFGQTDAFTKAFKLEGMGATTAQVNEYRANLAKLEELKTAEAIKETIAALVEEREELGLSSEQITIRKLLLQGANADQVAYAQSVMASTKAERDNAQAKAEGKALFEETRTPAEQLGAEISRLNALLQKGAIDWDTYARATFMAQDQFDAASKKAEETSDSFAKRFAENSQDILGQGLFDLMNGNFKNIGDSFTQMLNRMVAEAIAADLAKSLFGSLVKGGSGEGIFGSFLGSIFGSFGGPRAAGGPVASGSSYLVGEKGPELFVPRTSGTIVPADRTAAMSSGGMSIVNHFAITGPVDRRTQEQISNAVARGAQRVGYRGGV